MNLTLHPCSKTNTTTEFSVKIQSACMIVSGYGEAAGDTFREEQQKLAWSTTNVPQRINSSEGGVVADQLMMSSSLSSLCSSVARPLLPDSSWTCPGAVAEAIEELTVPARRRPWVRHCLEGGIELDWSSRVDASRAFLSISQQLWAVWRASPCCREGVRLALEEEKHLASQEI